MIYRSKLLSQFSELVLGTTDREWMRSNRHDRISGLAKQTELPRTSIFEVHQVHGKDIRLVDEHSDPSARPDGDALITALANRLLVINTADCVPVLFYAPQKGVIAAAHAGWRGTTKKIVQEVVKSMKSEYNIDPLDLFVAIGPSICGNCYDNSIVTDDRIIQFQALFPGQDVIREKIGHVTIDLPLANRLLCLEMGIPEHQIESSGICTLEDSRFGSFRRAPEELDESSLTYIGRRSR